MTGHQRPELTSYEPEKQGSSPCLTYTLTSRLFSSGALGTQTSWEMSGLTLRLRRPPSWHPPLRHPPSPLSKRKTPGRLWKTGRSSLTDHVPLLQTSTLQYLAHPLNVRESYSLCRHPTLVRSSLLWLRFSAVLVPLGDTGCAWALNTGTGMA